MFMFRGEGWALQCRRLRPSFDVFASCFVALIANPRFVQLQRLHDIR